MLVLQDRQYGSELNIVSHQLLLATPHLTTGLAVPRMRQHSAQPGKGRTVSATYHKNSRSLVRLSHVWDSGAALAAGATGL